MGEKDITRARGGRVLHARDPLIGLQENTAGPWRAGRVAVHESGDALSRWGNILAQQVIFFCWVLSSLRVSFRLAGRGGGGRGGHSFVADSEFV